MKDAMTDSNGWVLVPVEMTDAMANAFRGGSGWVRQAWKEAISAAPAPPDFAEHAQSQRAIDTARLDWLDKNPRIVIRSGKQHVRPLIDAMMLAQTKAPDEEQADALLAELERRDD